MTSPLCSKPFGEVFITITGDVHPCCSTAVPVGSLRRSSAQEIWEKGFEELRSQMRARELPDRCRHCLIVRLGLEVR
jgi:radical SAM protein with 4Fe4S-binding SPASM domain